TGVCARAPRRPDAPGHCHPSVRMTLRVLDPGLYTLVVDFGRPHCRSFGAPVGGAADRTSLALGNALVGNPPDAAALEITLAGPTLEAGCDLACVVYVAPFDLETIRKRGFPALKPRKYRGLGQFSDSFLGSLWPRPKMGRTFT